MCHIQEWTKNQSSSNVIKFAFLSLKMFALSMPPRMRKGSLFLRTPGWALKWDRSGQGFGSHWRGLAGSPLLLRVVQLKLSFLTSCPLFLSSFLPSFSPLHGMCAERPRGIAPATLAPGLQQPQQPAGLLCCVSPESSTPSGLGGRSRDSGLKQFSRTRWVMWGCSRSGLHLSPLLSLSGVIFLLVRKKHY